ncbi:MAG: putative thioredoxin [Parvibaculaceae bacterium]|jgi:putative thioredoxin|nr:co-chaperone YbbN [Parvibaculaceae bacterium]
MTTSDLNLTATPAAGELIKDTTTETFMADVVDVSMHVPVILDLWAPWCEPCKTLGPLLEKHVLAANGAVRMVKMDIEAYPEIAQQLRVQSIPAVFAFKDGQPVDAFSGAVPESQIKQFIEKVAGPVGPSPIDQALEAAAQAMDAGDTSTAAQIYAQVIEHEPTNVLALAGLAQCYVTAGELERAKEALGLVPPAAQNVPEVLAAHAALQIAEKSGTVSLDTTALEARIAADPKDHEARFELALAFNSAGARAEAIDALLQSIEIDRKWNDEAARKQLVEFFNAYGPMEDVSQEGRRRLSSILFS